MQFLYPNFLWAFALLSIPIIIHLFYFRRYKKVYFNNLDFLKEIKDEKNFTRKIRNLLILLARLLAISALILAFAQPLINSSKEDVSGVNYVSIYIDNSNSMELVANNKNLLNSALGKAEEIITSFGENTRFQIITNDRALSSRKFMYPLDARGVLNEVEISNYSKSINEIIEKSNIGLNAQEEGNRFAFFISDFQESIVGQSAQLDSTIKYHFVTLDRLNAYNLSLDSMWLDSPKPILNESQNLYFKITNYGDVAASSNVNLTLNDKTFSMGSVEIEPGKSLIDTGVISVNADSWHDGLIQITDQSVHFDDVLHFTFKPISKVNVLHVYDDASNKFISASMRNSSFFEYRSSTTDQLRFDQLQKSDLIILDELRNISSGLSTELTKFLERGGNICIYPEESVDNTVESFYLKFLNFGGVSFIDQKQSVFNLYYENPILNNVFDENARNLSLPNLERYARVNGDSPGRPIMTLRNGDAYLLEKDFSNGYIYFFAAAPNPQHNDIANFPEFLAPLYYKMSVRSNNFGLLYATLGKTMNFEIADTILSEDQIHVKNETSDVIPFQTKRGQKTTLYLKDLDLDKGIYDLSKSNNSLGRIAFNQDRQESNIRQLPISELQNLYPEVKIVSSQGDSNLKNILQAQTLGFPIWKYLIIFAIICLVAETFLLRFWKP